MTDDLHEAAVLPALTTRWVGRPYHHVAEIDSTNDRLKAWLAEGPVEHPPAGTVLLTEFQSAGRGRLGRRWEAPPGSSLLWSTLFRPGWPAARAGWLTMLAGLAVVEAIEASVPVEAALKWPNDIMLHVGDGWHKAGGLLLELQLDDDRLATAILGIGLNVNIPEGALPHAVTPATSLMVATGEWVPRRPLLLACLRQIETRYEAADRGESPQPAWNERLITLGRTVSVSDSNGSVVLEGMAEATDEWGSLLVRDEAGGVHQVAAGDVSLRGR